MTIANKMTGKLPVVKTNLVFKVFSMKLLFHVDLQRFVLSLVDFQCLPSVYLGLWWWAFHIHQTLFLPANPMAEQTPSTSKRCKSRAPKCLKKSLEKHGKTHPGFSTMLSLSPVARSKISHTNASVSDLELASQNWHMHRSSTSQFLCVPCCILKTKIFSRLEVCQASPSGYVQHLNFSKSERR